MASSTWPKTPLCRRRTFGDGPTSEHAAAEHPYCCNQLSPRCTAPYTTPHHTTRVYTYPGTHPHPPVPPAPRKNNVLTKCCSCNGPWPSLGTRQNAAAALVQEAAQEQAVTNTPATTCSSGSSLVCRCQQQAPSKQQLCSPRRLAYNPKCTHSGVSR